MAGESKSLREVLRIILFSSLLTKPDIKQLKVALNQESPRRRFELVKSEKNDAGATVVHWAANAEFSDVIDCIRESLSGFWADLLSQKERVTDLTPLMRAAATNNPLVVKALVHDVPYERRREILLQRDKAGNAPLHVAVKKTGSVETIRSMTHTLTKKDAFTILQLCDKNGKTVVHIACEKRLLDVVKYLSKL